jgi:hypothetical protein
MSSLLGHQQDSEFRQRIGKSRDGFFLPDSFRSIILGRSSHWLMRLRSQQPGLVPGDDSFEMGCFCLCRSRTFSELTEMNNLSTGRSFLKRSGGTFIITGRYDKIPVMTGTKKLNCQIVRNAASENPAPKAG